MKTIKVHLMDLVERYKAESAEWAYVEDTEHMTRGVMHWVITLKNVTMPKWESPPYRVAAHTFTLSYGTELVTDEYIAWQVLKRLEQAS